jgi:hypothetical protein
MKLLFSVATLMILKNCVLVSDAKLMIFANAICTIFISCLKCWRESTADPPIKMNTCMVAF